MPLNEIDRYVKEGRYAAALEAIDRVRQNEPNNPYTTAYEVRVRSLLEEAARNKEAQQPQAGLVIGRRYNPSARILPSVEQQIHSIASRHRGANEAEEQKGLSAEMQRLAVLSKIADLLSNATACLSRGEYEPALEALERASLLDQSNSDIPALEERVRAAQRETMALASKASARAASLEEILEEARTAAGKGDFSEALRSVTTASILDPDNPDVARCEDEIRRLQAERSHAEEEQKKEEQERQTREAAKQRSLEAEINSAEQERRHARALVAKHVARARALHVAGECAHALVEIDHAFLINPLDEEVRGLQLEISAARSADVQPVVNADHAKSSMIATYLADTQRLKAQGKSAEALSAISRVLILDPMNDEACAIERRIQADIARSTPFRATTTVHPHAGGDTPAAASEAIDSASPETAPEANRPRKRHKTYLMAASLLATAVVALLMLTQVLSHADPSPVQPDPVFPISDDTGEEPSLTAGSAQTNTQATLLPQAPRSGKVFKKIAAKDTGTAAAQAPAAADSIMEVLPGVRRLAQPDFPEEALGSDAEERVTVKVRVDSTGRALQAVVLMSTNEKFDKPVIDAVMHSSYTPWSVAGGKATRWLTIPLTFTR